MNPVRRIAHLDMDAFFASVELLSYPELKGEAVVVGGRNVQLPTLNADGTRHYTRLCQYAGRGVVTTSTYEARAQGVFSGMGLMKSAQLAPEAILLPANFEAYRDYSRKFKAAVANIAPLIEDRGIDEIYIDLTDIPESSLWLAKRIKSAVFEATGLTCSVGIAPNKLLAKIGSDLEKPDGITILGIDDLETRIWPLPARKINGVGPKAAEKLSSLQIGSIGELAATPIFFLVSQFGRTMGTWLHQVAHGIDDRELVIDRAVKSVSRETTFDRDLHAKQDRAELSEKFTAICQRLSDDLRRKGVQAKTIGVKLRYADFHVLTRDLTLPVPIDEGMAIRKTAGECLKRFPLEQKIRLVGVRASGIVSIRDQARIKIPVQGELIFE